MIGNDIIIYRTLVWMVRNDPGAQRPNGWLLKQATVSQIAEATKWFVLDRVGDEPGIPLPRRTVAHRLLAMQRKGFIVRFDSVGSITLKSSSSPLGVSWFIRTHDDWLGSLGPRTDVYTYGLRNRGFFVKDKDKKLVSPAEHARWHVDDDAAERSREADPLEPAATSMPKLPEPEPAPQRSGELRRPSRTALDLLTGDLQPPEDLNAILRELDFCRPEAKDRDARSVWYQLIKLAGDGPVPSPEEMAGMVNDYGIGAKKRNESIPAGALPKKLANRLAAWQRRQKDAALQSGKQRREARDGRINELITAMSTLESEETDERVLDVARHIVANGDLEEKAEARRIMAAQATRAG